MLNMCGVKKTESGFKFVLCRVRKVESEYMLWSMLQAKMLGFRDAMVFHGL